MKMPTAFIDTEGNGVTSSVCGRPLPEWQIMWLVKQGCTDIVFLTGDDDGKVRDYFRDGSRWDATIRYLQHAGAPGDGNRPGLFGDFNEECVVIDGSTLFDVPLAWLVEYQRSSLPSDSVCCALKYLQDTRQCRCMSVEESWAVSAIHERGEVQPEGYAIGGVYVAGRDFRQRFDIVDKSLENEILPKLISKRKLFGIPFGGKSVGRGTADSLDGDRSIREWLFRKKVPALFLDRDGVLIEDTGYVRNPDALVFNDRMFDISRRAQDKGCAIVVVTNQAGVAKGILSVEDVEKVNDRVRKKFESSGVRPAGIYWCPYHENGTVPEWTRASLRRKPEPGMVLTAVEEIGIDPLVSLMIGDKDTDRIRLPYLRTLIVRGKYPVDSRGDVVDISVIEEIIDSF